MVLFSRDLRVHDHPALTAALRESRYVVPMFVFDPRLLGRSSNRDRFLQMSLVDLDRSLARCGGRLIVRHGDPVEACVTLARQVDADSVHVSGDVSAYAIGRERRLEDALGRDGVQLRFHPGNAVVEPGKVTPAGRDAYHVFTPYHRAWVDSPRRSPLPAPGRIRVPDAIDIGPRPDPDAVSPDSIDLPPGGETPARRHFDRYLAGDAREYSAARNDLAADGTSRLSPYVRLGCLSANEAVHRLTAVAESGDLIRQFAWRDFFGQLLRSDPSLQWRSLHTPPEGATPVPDDADALLERWSEGLTGLPLVDAGMRQLRREGWIHNRARLVVASFLTRRLGVPWQEGSRVFMRWLVDGDPANNSGNWQWVAGTGADARRSRTLNPVRQAARFDPDGAYIRRYVRELRDVDPPLIFAPWIEPVVLRATGYPTPALEVPVGTGRLGPDRRVRSEPSTRRGQAALPM